MKERIVFFLDRRSVRATTVSALALASALLAASGTVSYTASDPRGTLLTAQAILEHGTFALDAYPGFPSGYRVVEEGGHRFYGYPPGTPIVAVPAVAIARLAGLDMVRAEDDDTLQRVLAAISVGAVAMLASLLALRWLPWPLATTLAAIFVFGTPVMSTMGTAFWSTNVTVVITLAVLLLLSGYDVSTGGPSRAAGIGLLLGFAFWCRPPAFLIAGLATLWMFRRAATTPRTERRSALVNALAFSVAVVVSPALLILMSRLTYGTWMPDYYIGARLAQTDRFGTALMAHLVSPSRGLLIYAPAAALAVVATLAWPWRVLRIPIAALAFVWVCLHLVLVSRFAYWWGGYSYGSRLMVDALPGVFVVACAAAAAVLDSARHWRVLGLLALIPASTFGIWINSVQGLFNPATMTWNVSPDIDRFPGYAFDWHVPQFLSTGARLQHRLQRHDRWLRAPLEPGVDYTAVSTRLEFSGWSAVEQYGSAVKRSTGRTPSVRFLVREDTLRGTDRLMLTFSIGAERPVTGQVWFNGEPLADLTVRTREPEHHVIGIPRGLVRTLDYDVLESNVLEWRATSESEGGSILLWALRVHAGRSRAM